MNEAAAFSLYINCPLGGSPIYYTLPTSHDSYIHWKDPILSNITGSNSTFTNLDINSIRYIATYLALVVIVVWGRSWIQYLVGAITYKECLLNYVLANVLVTLLLYKEELVLRLGVLCGSDISQYLLLFYRRLPVWSSFLQCRMIYPALGLLVSSAAITRAGHVWISRCLDLTIGSTSRLSIL
jgi:hypothetical protein